jgi:hypothetical protein
MLKGTPGSSFSALITSEVLTDPTLEAVRSSPVKKL